MWTARTTVKNRVRLLCVISFASLLSAAFAGAAQVSLYPGVASAPGANQTVWRTEAFVKNPKASTVDVLLELIPRDATNIAATKTLQLASGGEMNLPDLYAAMGAPSGAGTLRVTGDALTWVRTFNKATGGASFGQNVPESFATRLGPGETAFFPIHTPSNINKEVRCNFVLQSLAEEPQDLTLTVGNASKVYTLQAGTYHQFTNVGSWVGAAPGDATLAVVSTGRWAGFISAIDPLSGDPTTVLGEAWTDEFLLEPFNGLEGWEYSASSTGGASFKTANGALAVANYGGNRGGNGPAIRKNLERAADLTSADVSLDVAIGSPVGIGATGLDLEVALLDQYGVPIMAVKKGYWDVWMAAEGVESSHPSTSTFTGTWTVRESGGTYTLHHNGGPALATLKGSAARTAHAVEVTYTLESTNATPADVKIDLIRVHRH
jgi:hypothetical protein